MKYEVTLTLRPRMYSFTPQQQFDKVEHFLKQLCIKYKMSMIAELTQENNVHFHGIVDLKDFIHRGEFINEFRCMSTTFGRKTVNQVMYEESYLNYICKDVSITKHFVLNPVVLDPLGLTKDSFKQ